MGVVVPSLIGWNILAILVWMADDKSQLAAYTLLLTFIEIILELSFCIGYSQKVTISYFVSKRDLHQVKKAIKWSVLIILIDLAAMVAVNIGMLLLFLKFGSGMNADMAYYIKWAIPI